MSQSARHRKPVIGIVGGIGAGKSLVAEELRRLGCLVISADVLNAEILQTAPVAAQLREWWGERVFRNDGSVDRRKIAEIVFADAQARRRLESLTHPLIAARRAAIISAGVDEAAVRAIILDSPLLFESNLDSQCDRVVFVDAGEAQRRERLLATRGWDQAEIAKRERAQLSLAEKKSRSHVIIPNDGTPEQLRIRVNLALEEILRRFSSAH